MIHAIQIAILLAIALYLYWEAVCFCGERLHQASERYQRVDDLEYLLAVAKWIADRDAKATRDIPAKAFMDDWPDDVENDELLTKRLEKSIEITKRNPDAA